MSSMDQMKDDFLIRSGIMPRTLRQQSLYRLRQVIKSLSSTKQTIPLPTYNSFLERLLRSSQETVDSSSPAIIKIKSSNHFTPGVLWSSSASKVKRNLKSKQSSSRDLIPSWNQNGLPPIRKSSLNLSVNTSQTGEES